MDPRLIIQLPSGGALERALERQALPAGVVAELGATDAEGNLEASDVGEVVQLVIESRIFESAKTGRDGRPYIDRSPLERVTAMIVQKTSAPAKAAA